MGGVQDVVRVMAVRCFDCVGIMVCRRGLTTMVERFAGLFIGYQRGGGKEGDVEARGLLLVSSIEDIF